MAIRTNLKTLAPRREQYKREITLLSRGYTNPVAWPNGKITVYPWDNEINDWLANSHKNYASQQELTYALVQKCCNLNGGKIDDFIASECELILLVSHARLSSDVFKYTSTCPHCNFSHEETVSIPDELEPVGVKPPNYPGWDEITLPEIKDKVKLRPLTVRDERAVAERTPAERQTISDSAMRVIRRIVSINDSTPDTTEEAYQWYMALHPADSAYLVRMGQQITPHLNAALTHKCDRCSKEFKFPLDFSAEFFR